MDEKTVARFRSKVDKRGPDECWIWTGAVGQKGYGHTRIAGRDFQAHRLSWTLVNGPIADGLCVCHRCDNPPCCNPDHLFLGTNDDNVRDAIRKQRHISLRAIGGLHHEAKLSPESVRAIRKRLADGESRRSIARGLLVAYGTIQAIAERRTWKHVE